MLPHREPGEAYAFLRAPHPAVAAPGRGEAGSAPTHVPGWSWRHGPVTGPQFPRTRAEPGAHAAQSDGGSFQKDVTHHSSVFGSGAWGSCLRDTCSPAAGARGPAEAAAGASQMPGGTAPWRVRAHASRQQRGRPRRSPCGNCSFAARGRATPELIQAKRLTHINEAAAPTRAWHPPSAPCLRRACRGRADCREAHGPTPSERTGAPASSWQGPCLQSVHARRERPSASSAAAPPGAQWARGQIHLNETWACGQQETSNV